MGFDEPEEGVEKASEGVYEKQSISKIHMNAVVGVETGNKVIWMQPYKNAPFHAAKCEYKKINYDSLLVLRNCSGCTDGKEKFQKNDRGRTRFFGNPQRKFIYTYKSRVSLNHLI